MDAATIIGLLTAYTGARMQNRAQDRADERQAQAIAAAQAEQDALAQQRQAQIMESAARFEVPQTMQQLEQVIAPQQQRLEGVAQQAAQASVARPAGASGRFDTEMARRSASELQKAIDEAGMAARAGGGQRLQFEQGLQGADDASGLNDISAVMASRARQSNRNINNAGRVNTGNMMAGGLLAANAPTIGSGIAGMIGGGR